MQFAVIIGSVAAVASTISFAPQAWKIIRTRETQDISAAMYCFTVAAFALWSVYGLMLSQWPLVASNLTCFCLSSFILAMTLVSGRTKAAIADAFEK
jgi:MtN3 and saliva related transmembrane protein